MVIETGAVLFEICGKAPVTGWQTEHPVDGIDGLPRGKSAHIRAEIRAVLRDMQLCGDARIGRIGNLDIVIALVILQKDIVGRLMLFDERAFQHERFIFGSGHDEIVVEHLRNHFRGLDVVIGVIAEIAGDAVSEVFRLSDIDDLPLLVLHDIHAGLCGQNGGFALEIGQSRIHVRPPSSSSSSYSSSSSSSITPNSYSNFSSLSVRTSRSVFSRFSRTAARFAFLDSG